MIKKINKKLAVSLSGLIVLLSIPTNIVRASTGESFSTSETTDNQSQNSIIIPYVDTVTVTGVTNGGSATAVVDKVTGKVTFNVTKGLSRSNTDSYPVYDYEESESSTFPTTIRSEGVTCRKSGSSYISSTTPGGTDSVSLGGSKNSYSSATKTFSSEQSTNPTTIVQSPASLSTLIGYTTGYTAPSDFSSVVSSSGTRTSGRNFYLTSQPVGQWTNERTVASWSYNWTSNPIGSTLIAQQQAKGDAIAAKYSWPDEANVFIGEPSMGGTFCSVTVHTWASVGSWVYTSSILYDSAEGTMDYRKKDINTYRQDYEGTGYTTTNYYQSTVNYTYTLTNSPPTIDFNASKTTINRGEDVLLNWSITDADGDSFTTLLDGIGISPIGNLLYKSAVPIIKNYTMVSTDSKGGSTSKQVTINVINRLPVITGSPYTATVGQNQSINLSWSSIDPDLDVMTCEVFVDGVKVRDTLSSDNFIFVSSVVGSHNVEIKVKDSYNGITVKNFPVVVVTDPFNINLLKVNKSIYGNEEDTLQFTGRLFSNGSYSVPLKYEIQNFNGTTLISDKLFTSIQSTDYAIYNNADISTLSTGKYYILLKGTNGLGSIVSSNKILFDYSNVRKRSRDCYDIYRP